MYSNTCYDQAEKQNCKRPRTHTIFKKKANNGYHRLKIHDLHDLSELSSHPIDISIYIYDILTGFILLHVYFQRSSKVL